MVSGYHLIWTAYGYWLPNDPRGSGSESIRVQSIAELGPLHHGRKSVQPKHAEIRQFHDLAVDALSHKVYLFSDEEIEIVGRMIGSVIRERRYVCHACAVMPDHVHLVVLRHVDFAETMIENLQLASRAALIANNCRSPNHPVWTHRGWKVFLNTIADFESRIQYTRNNYLKSGMPIREWDFVTPYDGWLADWYS